MILLFATLIYIGYSLSKSCKDLFASYLSFGFRSLLMVQVFINIIVVIGLIPVTGVTLPFIQHPHSSLYDINLSIASLYWFIFTQNLFIVLLFFLINVIIILPFW